MTRLTAIIHGFEGNRGTEIFRRVFAPYSVEYCLRMSRYEEDAPAVAAAETVWWGHGQLGRVDWNTVRPIDEELIENMRRTEMVVMDMLSRQETGGRMLSYAERKRLYLQYLRYWHHILIEKRVNAFFSYQIPHRPQVFVLYDLCKLMGIPTLCFHPGPLTDTMLYLEDWEQPSVALEKEFALLQKRFSDSKEEIVLSPPLQQFYSMQVQSTIQPKKHYPNDIGGKPFEMRYHIFRILQKANLRIIVRLVGQSLRQRFHGEYWIRRVRSAHRRLYGSRLYAWYDRKATLPDLSKKFIYVPLQQQPESSTCPIAGAFVDQQLQIHLLASLLPKDVFIYIKEHPNQQRLYPNGLGRSIDFYKELLSIPCVRFIDRTCSSFSLLQHCIAVATGTGTAGFEALFRCKPVLMFGHWFYQYAPGVYPIRSTEDCAKAIPKILEGKPTMSDRMLRLFLKALENVLIPGVVDPYLFQSSRISEEVTVEAASRVLTQKLNDYVPA